MNQYPPSATSPFDHVTAAAPNGAAPSGTMIPVPDLDTFTLREGLSFRMDACDAAMAFAEIYEDAKKSEPPVTQREYLGTCRAYVATWDQKVAEVLSLGQLEWLVDHCAILSAEKKSERAAVYRNLVGSPRFTGSGRGN